jgi:hypothetical protein
MVPAFGPFRQIGPVPFFLPLPIVSLARKIAVSGGDELRQRLGVPAAQDNLARAAEMAFASVAGQSDGQLLWLGAQRQGAAWQLPVLDDTFRVDLPAGRITTSAGRAVGPHWSILVLHYLSTASRPERRRAEATFADLAAARSYAGVYHQRVIARLCATVGRDAQALSAAARRLGGQAAEAGDLAFDFDVFPRLAMRLIWHAADEEFAASATLLMPENIESYFSSEDIVVLSERLVSRLAGRPF